MTKKVIKIEALPKIMESTTSIGYKRRVAAYARVSTSYDEQLMSIEAQKDYYRSTSLLISIGNIPGYMLTRPFQKLQAKGVMSSIA